MHYFLISGEASGDLHGSHLIEQLKARDNNARFTFLGGDKMAEAAGVAPLIHYREMAYMGISEVLRHLGSISKNLKHCRQALLKTKPDALVLIDYPSFNLKVAKTAFNADIPVYYYISPKIWAWKKWRVKVIRQLVRQVYCILPFEPDFYRENEYDNAIYIGNPSVGEIDTLKSNTDSRDVFLAKHKLRDRALIALMPGSRKSEIRNNLPIMIQAIDRFPQYRGVIVGAPAIEDSLYRQYGTDSVPVIRESSAVDILAHCRAAIVTSGTATLETALMGVPQVSAYRGNGKKLTYQIMKRILSINFVTLPNLIVGRQIIPEMLQHLCTANNIADQLTPLLRQDSDATMAQIAGYNELRQRLGADDAAENTATLLIHDLKSLKNK